MEYTKLQYFLFRIGELFNSKLFMLVIALIVIIGAALFFAYDYKHDGPILSSNSRQKNRNNEENKHAKKYNPGKKELLYAVIPILLILILFVAKSAFSRVPDPNTIIPSKNEKTATIGKVIWIHNTTGKIGITNDKRNPENPIVAKIDNMPLPPNVPIITSYAGTSISNKEFLSLKIGDTVKIKVHPYEWKYKNHDEFGDDKSATHVKDLLNQANVNGTVVKTKEQKSNKKTSKKKSNVNTVNPYKTTNGYSNSEY